MITRRLLATLFPRSVSPASSPEYLEISPMPDQKSPYVFVSAVQRVVEKHKAGQGVQNLDFAAERGLFNRAVAKQRESSGANVQKSILTRAKKAEWII